MARKSESVPQEERDPYEGMGGSYVIDPATDRRQLVERTKYPREAGEPSASKTETTAIYTDSTQEV